MSRRQVTGDAGGGQGGPVEQDGAHRERGQATEAGA